MSMMFESIQTLSMILVLSYLLSHLGFFKNQEADSKLSIPKNIAAVVIFLLISLLGIISSLFSDSGTYFDTRLVGVVLASLLFDWPVGAAVMATTLVVSIVQLPAMFVADAIAIVAAFALCRVAVRAFPKDDALLYGIMVGAVELAHMLLIAAIVQPNDWAKAFVYTNSYPTIVLNGCMVILFILIIREHDRGKQLWDKEASSRTQLEQAEYIQRTLLEDEFRVDWRLDLDAFLRPALDVGGDLYGFNMQEGRYFCFIVGDVSGKGIPAAIMMSRCKTAFSVVAKDMQTPEEILSHINLILNDHNKAQMFVTAIAGVLDLETGMLAYANAGHTQPYRIALAPRVADEQGERQSEGQGTPTERQVEGQTEGQGAQTECQSEGQGAQTEGQTERQTEGAEEHTSASTVVVSEIEKPCNPAMGLFTNMTYETLELQLQPGDYVFLYTDGAIDAMDRQDRRLGNDGLVAILEKATPPANVRCGRAHMINTGVQAAIDDYQPIESQFDDVALFTFGWNPQPLHYDVVPTLDCMIDAEREMRANLDVCGVSVALRDDILLVVEEVVSNIIKYGYGNIALENAALDGAVMESAAAGNAALGNAALGNANDYLSVSSADVIGIDIWPFEQNPSLRIQDAAPAYDPFNAPKPDVSLPGIERPMGKMGIHIIRPLVASYTYQSNAGINILEMVLYGREQQADPLSLAGQMEAHHE